MLQIAPDIDMMTAHLEHVFGGYLDGLHEGLIEIAHTDGRDRQLKHARLFPTDEIEEAVAYAAKANLIEHQNVYVGAGLRMPDSARDKRAGDNGVLALTSYYVDLDQSDAAALAKQRYRACPPTCAVITGRTPHLRAQLWWRQETPETDLDRAKSLNKSLCMALGGDRTVVNPGRVLRLAGSIAWPLKPERVLERTELVLFENRLRSYPAHMLAKAFPPIHEPEAETRRPRLEVERCIEAIRKGDQWHNNMLRLIGHWTARGWTDSEILLAAEGLTLSGYTIQQTREEALIMLEGARRKWQRPESNVRDLRPALVPTFVSSIADKPIAPRRWILDKALLRGHVTLLVAPPGTGKSSLCLGHALAIATGKPLTGIEVVQQGKVWVYNNEDELDELKRRLVALLQHHRIEQSAIQDCLALSSGADTPFMVAHAENGHVVRQPDVEACIKAIKASGISVFIVDPFIETHEVNENSNEQIKAVAQLYRVIAREADCAVLLVHHTGKQAPGTTLAGNINAARGASALAGVARIVQTLFQMTDREAATFGLSDAQHYVRLDDAKSNLAPQATEPRWYKTVGVEIPNGDQVGVIIPATLSKPKAAGGKDNVIMAALLKHVPESKITLNAAACKLAWSDDPAFTAYRETDPRGYKKCTRPLRDAISQACLAQINVKGHGFALDTSVRPATLLRVFQPVSAQQKTEGEDDEA